MARADPTELEASSVGVLVCLCRRVKKTLIKRALVRGVLIRRILIREIWQP